MTKKLIRKKPNIFNILNPKNLKVVEKQLDDGSSRKVISGFKKPLIEERIKELPNQIKSILLFNNANGAVNPEKFVNVNDLSSYGENAFNFEMIKKIERLAGYEISKTGEVLIKQPIWKTLTEADYQKLIGKEILCRLVSYENHDVGIMKNRGAETTNYDEIFTLVPVKINDFKPLNITPILNENNGSIPYKIKNQIKTNFADLDVVMTDSKTKKGQNLVTNLINMSAIDLTKDSIISDKTTKRKVEVSGKRIEVSADLAIDAIALNCQIDNVELDYTFNNTIPSKKIDTVLNNKNILTAMIEKQQSIADENDDNDCSVFDRFKPSKTC